MTKYERYVHRFNSEELDFPLHDHNPSDLEKYLRFIHATNAVLRNVKNTYHPVEAQLPRDLMPNHIIDFKAWYSNKGVFVTTKTVSQSLNVAWEKEFREDPLYEEFQGLMEHPIHSLSWTVESAKRDPIEEFDKLGEIFDKECSNPNWMKYLPKGLLVTKKSRSP